MPVKNSDRSAENIVSRLKAKGVITSEVFTMKYHQDTGFIELGPLASDTGFVSAQMPTGVVKWWLSLQTDNISTALQARGIVLHSGSTDNRVPRADLDAIMAMISITSSPCAYDAVTKRIKCTCIASNTCESDSVCSGITPTCSGSSGNPGWCRASA